MKHYDNETKQKAIKLAMEIGTKRAADQLGISFFTISDCRRKNLSKSISSIRVGNDLAYGQSHIVAMENELKSLKEANILLQRTVDYLIKSKG